MIQIMVTVVDPDTLAEYDEPAEIERDFRDHPGVWLHNAGVSATIQEMARVRSLSSKVVHASKTMRETVCGKEVRRGYIVTTDAVNCQRCISRLKHPKTLMEAFGYGAVE